MISSPSKHIFLCNGATLSAPVSEDIIEHKFDYLGDESNVTIKLAEFVQDVSHLPEIILDLLEIAGYVFAADRSAVRGNKDLLEYHRWGRFMQFVIKVRKDEFWNREEIKNILSQALTFMTGDREYKFEFQPGHQTPPQSLFDVAKVSLASYYKQDRSIILFSGGLDSLAGTVKHINENQGRKIILISHQSGQPSTKSTQNRLSKALRNTYSDRVEHYKFECSLRGHRAAEETQRTRAFLYCVVAFAISFSLETNEFFFYENGITSLNLPRQRQDLINSRASRTTHPNTIGLMTKFLSMIAKEIRNDQNISIEIQNPFKWLTKADVLREIKKFNQESLISSTVSCSASPYHRPNSSNHCGRCFQCVDRRIAMYTVGVQEWDKGSTYGTCFDEDLGENAGSTVGYIGQAVDFGKMTIDQFYEEYFVELEEIDEDFEKIYSLVRKHKQDVLLGLSNIREEEDLSSSVPHKSFYGIISEREYLKLEPLRMAEKLSEQFKQKIPIAFQKEKPGNERQLNDYVESVLADNEDLLREFPAVNFGLKKVIPDHELRGYNLLIECKYPRETRKLDKINEEIAADIVQFPTGAFILFIVYDPSGQINNIRKFESDISRKAREKNTESLVCVIK